MGLFYERENTEKECYYELAPLINLALVNV